MWPRLYRSRKLLRTPVPAGGVVSERQFCHSEDSLDETEATAQTRDGCSGRNTGTGQAFDFPRPPDCDDEVLRLWRRNYSGLDRTPLLGLPPLEDQRLARDRTADARAGIVLQQLSCPDSCPLA